MEWRLLYPFIMFAGLTTAYFALRKRYQSGALTSEQRTAIGLAAFTGAMLGSKLPFLLESKWQDLTWSWLSDGKTILGGILGGYLAVEATKPWVGVSIRTGDYFAIPIAIAVAFGRVGCFFSGCCFGTLTEVPWGIHFPTAQDPPGVLRHPTQLYEATFHGLAIAALLWSEHKDLLKGHRLTAYLFCYLVYRFVTEWIRPEPVLIGSLTSYQVACIILLMLLIVAEVVNFRRSQNSAAPATVKRHPPS